MTEPKTELTTCGRGKDPAPGGVFAALGRSSWLRTYVPKALRRLGRRFVSAESLEAYNIGVFASVDEYADAEEVSTYPAKVDVRLGIVKDVARTHGCYIGACREMGVPYRLLDIAGADWIDVIRRSECDAFLVRPSFLDSRWKRMYDERLRTMACDMGKIIYPTYGEIWLYESKRRACYWLESHDVPHPRTWVFYDRSEALDFCRSCPLPIVYKSDLGSGATGVRILRKRASLLRLAKRCFGKGMLRADSDRRDCAWGSILLQEFIPEAREWRMIRIGASYFGYEKFRRGDFHSGAHVWRHGLPPDSLLDFTKHLTDKGGFSSMDIDVLVSPEGRFYAIELQTLFGMGHPYEMCVVDGKPGRMVQDAETHSWRFEPGSFCQNYMQNLRVQVLLDMLQTRGRA